MSEYVPSWGRDIGSIRADDDAGFRYFSARMIADRLGRGGEIMGQVYHWESHPYGFDVGPIYWPKVAQAPDEKNGPSGTDIRLNFRFRLHG